MSVSASRKYRILEIAGRRFIETAHEAGRGTMTVKAIWQQIPEIGSGAASPALAEMPGDFHPAIHESVARAIDTRLPRLETALATN